jgi:hypothetical protein
VSQYTEGFDRDRRESAPLWRYLGHDTQQTANSEALVSWPAVDGIVRHPRVLPLVRELMGGPLAVLGVSIRHMDAHAGPPAIPQQWHGDVQHRDSHPLRINYLQSMVYLTDVSAETHCFAIVPEAVDEPYEGWDAQAWSDRAEAGGGGVELYGPAGTVILFNASAVHAGTVRETAHERKTVQTYYCHPPEPPGSINLTIPVSLWRDHEDPEARELYGPQASIAAVTGHRELRAGHIDIELAAAPAVAVPGVDGKAVERCPWDEAEGGHHRCVSTNESVCRHYRGLKSPDVVVCGYPRKEG